MVLVNFYVENTNSQLAKINGKRDFIQSQGIMFLITDGLINK